MSDNQEVKSTNPLDSDETAIAASQFANFSRQIRQAAGIMNLRGLHRVLMAFVEFPYTEKDPVFQKKSEEELFILLLANEKAKSVIHKAVEANRDIVENGVVSEIINKE